MDTIYHDQIIRAALGDLFKEADLRAIFQANIGQDRLASILWHPEYHFDGNDFLTPQCYIEAERQQAVDAILKKRDRQAALDAFGRLLHARQDFYAHSNWIPLWAEQQGGVEKCRDEAIELCLDPTAVPTLRAGTAEVLDILLYLLYRIPLVGPWIKHLYLPPGSHEAMNIDDPSRGPLFPFVMAAAIKHTRLEFEQLREALEAAGGAEAVALLRGEHSASSRAA
ncbi:MAG: hypothetical protein H0T73_06085 [Ardenticatenales bacterium]|nr:hypothetical protein [Ardenticatenales bacterium]